MRFHRCVEQKLNIDPIKACHNITDHNCMSIIPTETETETVQNNSNCNCLILLVKIFNQIQPILVKIHLNHSMLLILICKVHLNGSSVL